MYYVIKRNWTYSSKNLNAYKIFLDYWCVKLLKEKALFINKYKTLNTVASIDQNKIPEIYSQRKEF